MQGNAKKRNYTKATESRGTESEDQEELKETAIRAKNRTRETPRKNETGEKM